MSTYRVYADRITKSQEDYDASNPGGSGDAVEYRGSLIQAVDEAGKNEAVKDTIVFMEACTRNVPVMYARDFYVEWHALKYGGTAEAVYRIGSIGRQLIKPAGTPFFVRRQPTVVDSTHRTVDDWLVQSQDGTTRYTRYPDKETDEEYASSYTRVHRTSKNVDMLVAPGLEGKVILKMRAPSDDTDGGPAVDGACGIDLPFSSDSYKKLSDIYTPAFEGYGDNYPMQRMSYFFGIYLPFKRMSGFKFISGGAGALSDKEHTDTDGSLYKMTRITKYAGFLATPRNVDHCTFDDVPADLWTTESIEDCVFNRCSTTVFSPITGIYTADFRAGGTGSDHFGWAPLDDPFSVGFLSSYVSKKYRFRRVNRCVFENMSVPRKIVSAALVSNSVFRNNDTEFPVGGIVTGCAFVDSKYCTPYAPGYTPSHALVFNSYFVRCSRSDSEKAVRRLESDIEWNDDYEFQPPTEYEESSSLLGSLKNLIRAYRYTFVKCVFDSMKFPKYKNWKAWMCKEDPEIASFVKNDGLVDPSKSPGSLMCLGIDISRLFPMLATRYKLQDQGFDSLYDVQSHDFYGNKRLLFDSGFVSIGPVSESFDGSSLSLVVARITGGFGSAEPAIQLCRRGATCSIDVKCARVPKRVLVNGEQAPASRRINVTASSEFVYVEIDTTYDLFVTAGNESVDNQRADGTQTNMFSNFRHAIGYAARRIGGSAPDTFAVDLLYSFNTSRLTPQEIRRVFCGPVPITVQGSGAIERSEGKFDVLDRRVVVDIPEDVEIDGIDCSVENGLVEYACHTDGTTVTGGRVSNGLFYNFNVAASARVQENSTGLTNCRVEGAACAPSATRDGYTIFASDVDATTAPTGANQGFLDYVYPIHGTMVSSTLRNRRRSLGGPGRTVVNTKGCRLDGFATAGTQYKSYVTNTENAPVENVVYRNLAGGYYYPTIFNTIIHQGSFVDSFVDRLLEVPRIEDTRKYETLSPVLDPAAEILIEELCDINLASLGTAYVDSMLFLLMFSRTSMHSSSLIGRFLFGTSAKFLSDFHTFLWRKMSSACGNYSFETNNSCYTLSITTQINPRTNTAEVVQTKTYNRARYEGLAFDTLENGWGWTKIVTPVTPTVGDFGNIHVVADRFNGTTVIDRQRRRCIENAEVFHSMNRTVCLPVLSSFSDLKTRMHASLSDRKNGFYSRLVTHDDRRFFVEEYQPGSGSENADSCSYIQAVAEYIDNEQIRPIIFSAEDGKTYRGLCFDTIENDLCSGVRKE